MARRISDVEIILVAILLTLAGVAAVGWWVTR